MAQNTNILQELVELKSTLAQVAPQNVYEIPDGYFEGLANLMLNRVKAMDAADASEELKYLSPLLSDASRTMPHAVPANYFDGLENRLMNYVKDAAEYDLAPNNQSASDELKSISPFLSGLNKTMPFTVPSNYFEDLSSRQEESSGKVVPFREQAKVVAFRKKKWLRLAAAAAITGIIALGGLLYFNNRNKDLNQSFAKFEKKLDKEIKKTSDQELSDFIQQFTIAGLNGEEKAFNDPKAEPKEYLKDVPESELKQFLQETADPDLDDDLSLMN